MREIKFRGIDVETKEFVYGTPIITNKDDNPKYFIVSCEYSDISMCLNGKITYTLSGYDYKENEIIPKTLGQFTGLKDKNGKDIYEGDILQHDSFYEGDYKTEKGIGYIKFEDFTMDLYNFKDKYITDLFQLDKNIDCEVIGNIHDNPELLDED